MSWTRKKKISVNNLNKKLENTRSDGKMTVRYPDNVDAVKDCRKESEKVPPKTFPRT